MRLDHLDIINSSSKCKAEYKGKQIASVPPDFVILKVHVLRLTWTGLGCSPIVPPVAVH